MHNHKLYTTVGFLLVSTLLSGAILSAPKVNADTTSAVSLTVNVPAVCSLTPAATTLTKTITPGTLETIGTSNLKAICNDPSGFAIYAVGYTDDAYGNNVLAANFSTETNVDIISDTAETGNTSNWYVSIAPIAGDYAPTIENGFNQPSIIPTEYTKVASFDSNTDNSVGGNITSTYKAYIAPNQMAGTYEGKVKYLLVHPSTIVDAPDSLYSMQNVSEWKNSITDGEEIVAVDARDGKTYTVARLADGNLWMTQNLDLDIDSTKTYTSDDTDLPAGVTWTPSRSTYKSEDGTWLNINTIPESYDPGDIYWNGVIDNYGAWDDYWDSWDDDTESFDDSLIPFSSLTSTEGDSHYHFGNYYNWTAAIAMNDSSNIATGGEETINQSICPSGWKMPSSGNGEDSIYGLAILYGTVDPSLSEVRDMTDLLRSPAYFVPSGYHNDETYEFGSRGGFWTSVGYYNNWPNAHDLNMFLRNNTIVGNPSGGRGRSQGNPVRCLARD